MCVEILLLRTLGLASVDAANKLTEKRPGAEDGE